MTDIKIGGKSTKTTGYLPEVGDQTEEFLLTGANMGDINSKDYEGKNIVLNIFPSIDTGICAASVRRFNTEAAKLDDTVVICVSMDLPFAHGRFCEAEGIKNVISASAFRSPGFIKDYCVVIDEGPTKGLLARSVLVIDKTGKVIHSELVQELASEPEYDEAIDAITRSGIPVPEQKSTEQVPLDRCRYTATAENSRMFHDDDACDDGRAG